MPPGLLLLDSLRTPRVFTTWGRRSMLQRWSGRKRKKKKVMCGALPPTHEKAYDVSVRGCEREVEHARRLVDRRTMFVTGKREK